MIIIWPLFLTRACTHIPRHTTPHTHDEPLNIGVYTNMLERVKRASASELGTVYFNEIS